MYLAGITAPPSDVKVFKNEFQRKMEARRLNSKGNNCYDNYYTIIISCL